jgi:CPA1 family monovalent cation:H+ antiporter
LKDIEFLLLLLLAAMLLVRGAELVRVPYPVMLVVGGLAIGLVPGAPDVELEPEVVFLIFLPPLLHAAGWYSSPRELWAEVRPLAVLAVGLVLATMAAVAVVAHAVVPGMSWEAAFVLGAIVGPTDPVSAQATFSRLGAPARMRMLVEGESMINDATALVAFRVALVALTEGAFSLGDALVEFVTSAAGGALVGLAVGWLFTQVIRRQSNTALSILLSVLTAYTGYIVAEEAGVSGVLGAVFSGLYSGWYAHTALDAGTRLSAVAFWQVMVLGLEGMLFILLGLQAPQVAEEVHVAPLVAQALLVGLVVIAVRMAFALVPAARFGDTWRERVVVGWAGMRGAISLAAALAVPLEVDERPEILLITFLVILVTLLGQGLTLAPLLRWLRLQGEERWSPDEATARLETAQAALDRLEELEDEGAAGEPVRRLRELYRGRFALCVAILGGGDLPEDGRPELKEYGAMRRELLAAERAALLGLRNDGKIRGDMVRKIERDLDLDEARIRPE